MDTVNQTDQPQWEYRSVRPPREETMKEASDPTDRLNELGADGWEVATTIEYAGGGTKYIIMKRLAETGSEHE
jgi:hypothetical protein